ncbi:hypothetical protein [Rhizobium sp. RAF56]|uniref:hypothetical protein n=1 Tax=Rhizobium sp. RAF56 TaxID=3233062 RepID=UPI003F94C979
MPDGFVIHGFRLGDGAAMGYEATGEDAYRAARTHRQAMQTDPEIELPARTSIHRIVLRPVTKEIMLAVLREDDGALSKLVQTMEAIGYVD